MIARIITYWQQVTVDGTTINKPYLPALAQGESWKDVTEQEAGVVGSTPNAVVLELNCRPGTLDVLEANPDVIVLWSE